MFTPVIKFVGWIHRNVFWILLFTFASAAISAVMRSMVGGSAALIALRLQFICLVMWLLTVLIYFMFWPFGKEPSGWILTILPFRLRLVILMIAMWIGLRAIAGALVLLLTDLAAAL